MTPDGSVLFRGLEGVFRELSRSAWQVGIVTLIDCLWLPRGF